MAKEVNLHEASICGYAHFLNGGKAISLRDGPKGHNELIKFNKKFVEATHCKKVLITILREIEGQPK